MLFRIEKIRFLFYRAGIGIVFLKWLAVYTYGGLVMEKSSHKYNLETVITMVIVK